MSPRIRLRLSLSISMLGMLVQTCVSQTPNSPLSPEDFLKLKRVSSVAVNPAGTLVAYTVDTQRKPTEDPGPANSELFILNVRSKETTPYVTRTRVSSLEWKPDGSAVAFLMKRGEKAQVWAISASGGEAVQLTSSDEPVLVFHWHPDGQHIAYVAQQSKNKRDKRLEEKGYGFVFFEENLRSRNLYLAGVSQDSFPAPTQLTKNISVWSFEFSDDGHWIALAASDRPLVDESYMSQKIHLLNLQTGAIRHLATPPGKLGNLSFSPDGLNIAYVGAISRQDHAVSQVYTVPTSGGSPFNATPTDYRGHVTWVGWKDKQTVLYRSADGVTTSYRTSRLGGRESSIYLNTQEAGVAFDAPSIQANSSLIAFIGQSANIPGDVYLCSSSHSAERATTVNPWLAQRTLGNQTIVRYKARDGKDIEGLVIHPVGEEASQRYPLLVVVHGGPESHYNNGWLTSYAEPGQVFAGKGYMVFYPNYRASTGYGVAFAAEGYGDAAGKEFDDIADGIDYLCTKGQADRERVGLGGGSYGGFASAWFATYYTKYVRAVVMFVGISDLISKQSTTDIPNEDVSVHTGKPVEQTWEFSLKRSPIYWAHQSTTATLICGGSDDTRVHPSQSIELYRRMKVNNHPAVRLVQYPGEQHGNAKQPGRIDLLYRTLEWYDWYVRDAKPVNGPMPRLDISDRYGLELP
jgi:dipeptidyl aminopeptidase/acylaminoacyl peptidase